MTDDEKNIQIVLEAEIKKLRNITPEGLIRLSEELTAKRIAWYQKMKQGFKFDASDPVGSGYRLLLLKLGINPEEAPVVSKTRERIVFHSQNFCPTLEVCRILNLDTRMICKQLNEKPTDALMKQLNPRLEFGRNYQKLRPYCEYCEEMVMLK